MNWDCSRAVPFLGIFCRIFGIVSLQCNYAYQHNKLLYYDNHQRNYSRETNSLKIPYGQIVFWFFNFTLEYLTILQSSEPLHAKMNPTSCLFGLKLAYYPVFLLAGALLFDEKIHQSAALSWFGLRDVGNLYSRAVIQRTIDVSPAFFEHGGKDRGLSTCKPWSK